MTSCNLSKGQLIVEIRGKFLLSDEQPGKSDCLFFYRFPKDSSQIVVDGTGHENLARYARRSCRPNAEVGIIHLYHRHFLHRKVLQRYICVCTFSDEALHRERFSPIVFDSLGGFE